MTYKLIDPRLTGEQRPLRAEEGLDLFVLTLMVGLLPLNELVVVGPDGSEEPALDFIDRHEENFFSPEHDQREALEDLLIAWRAGTPQAAAIRQAKLTKWWPALGEALARYARAMDRRE